MPDNGEPQLQWWNVEIEVQYTVEVEAESQEEAEELAIDEFHNDAGAWDTDIWAYRTEEDDGS